MPVEQYGSFTFRYVVDYRASERIRIYVLSQPSYNGRDTSPGTIHRWPEGHDGFDHPPYICIKEDYKPETLTKAMELAHRWANMTMVYIRTGVPISAQISRG